MSNQADVQTALDTLTQKVGVLGDELTDFSGDFSAAVDALKAQIAAGAPDLAPQVAALSALSDKLDTFSTALSTLDTTAEGISGKPTPITPPQ